jgi:NAD(P)-dependent dehydrogenase (short-subunit alcohol dehydrogenase family)
MCSPDLLDRDLASQTYIITGANCGIGFTTAQQLAQQGATVVLACRARARGEEAHERIRVDLSDAKIEVRELDLANLDSVRRFVRDFEADHDELHGLVNNAGVMNTPKGKTADGFETQFGTNHLGHFLLTELLLDRLKRSRPARIVNLSSAYHDRAQGREGVIDFDDLHFETRAYDGWRAYAQSKLANVLHARELAARLEGTGVTAVSVHPGWVKTRLIRHTIPVWLQNALGPLLRSRGLIDVWEGSQTTLHALLAEDIPRHNGAFFSQRGEYRDPKANRGGWPLPSPNPHAHDDESARRLFAVSRELVGLSSATETV